MEVWDNALRQLDASNEGTRSSQAFAHAVSRLLAELQKSLEEEHLAAMHGNVNEKDRSSSDRRGAPNSCTASSKEKTSGLRAQINLQEHDIAADMEDKPQRGTTKSETSGMSLFEKSSHGDSEGPKRATTGMSTMSQVNFELWPAWERTASLHNGALAKDKSMFGKVKEQRMSSFQSFEDLAEETLITDTVVLSRSRCVLMPQSLPRMLWEAVGVLVLIYDLCMISMQVFDVPSSSATTAMAYIILWYWTFDIFASCFVGYFQGDGELVMSFRKVVWKYATSWMLLDVLVVLVDWLTVGFIMFGDDAPQVLDSLGVVRISKLARVARVLRLLRVLRVRRVKGLLRSIEDQIGSEKTAIGMSLVEKIMSIVVINHVLACLWFGVGKAGNADELGNVPWIVHYDLVDKPWSYQYLGSLHWSITQFTPGSSSVQPQTNTERVCCILVLLFALVVFSMFVSSATSQITRLFGLQLSEKKKLWTLRKYLHQNKVTRDLGIRIFRYVQVALGTRRKEVRPDPEMMNLLSQPLREELYTQVLSRKVTTHPFFMLYSRSSPTVMRRICRKAISEVHLSTHDRLFDIGEACTCCFFVSAGVLHYVPYSKAGEQEKPKLVPQNTVVSEAVLWTPWFHRGDMRADVDSSLAALDASKFQDIVTQHYVDKWFVTQYADAFLMNLQEASAQGVVNDLQFDLLGKGHVKRLLVWHKFGPPPGVHESMLQAAESFCDDLESSGSPSVSLAVAQDDHDAGAPRDIGLTRQSAVDQETPYSPQLVTL